MSENRNADTESVPKLERKVFFRRVRFCPLSKHKVRDINFKNIKLISRFISEKGRFTPRRITAVSSSRQRILNAAIKHARHLAILPFLK